jgi:hypothetical protein
VQKSVEECERKGDRSENVGRLAGLKVGMLKKKRLTILSRKLKAKNRRGKCPEPLGISDSEGYFGGGGIEHSRLTLPRIIAFVKY